MHHTLLKDKLMHLDLASRAGTLCMSVLVTLLTFLVPLLGAVEGTAHCLVLV